MWPIDSRVKSARLLLAPAVMLLAACGASAPKTVPSPHQVTVTILHPRQIPVTRDYTGRLSAYREANVLARVPGVLLKRLYREGTAVRAGQRLFEIDPAPYRAALDGARAALAQARANATNAHVTAQRDRALIKSHLVSVAQLDTDQAAERSTAAAVKQAEANVETARINLGYTDVTSPIAGIAGEQQVTEGALVGQGTPTLLTTVDQIDPIYVNFDEPATQRERLAAQRQAGLVSMKDGDAGRVQITLPNGMAYGRAGTVDFQSATVDPSTGAIALRGIIPNPDHILLPGMFVDVRLTVGTVNHAFLVPQSSVQRNSAGNPYVLVVSDGKVLKKRVRTEGTRGPDWIVTAGLSDGDRLIVTGIQNAHPGKAVSVTLARNPPAVTGGGPVASP